MKRTLTICLIVAGILAVVLTVLVSLGSMRHEKIRQQPPLTIQELERLVQVVPPSSTKVTTAARSYYLRHDLGFLPDPYSSWHRASFPHQSVAKAP